MGELVYKVVFIDGQTLMGTLVSESDGWLIMKDVLDIKIIPISQDEAKLITMTPQHMKDEINIPINNFVKYYGVANEEGEKFYNDNLINIRAKKAGLVISPKDLREVKKEMKHG